MCPSNRKAKTDPNQTPSSGLIYYSLANQALGYQGNQEARMRTTGDLRQKLALLLIITVVAATTEMSPPRDSRQDHLSLKSAPLPIRFPSPTQVVADFDGDRLPDRAELSSNGFHKNIHLTLSSSWVTNLSFSTESYQQGSLHQQDIDHDSDNDLIWVSDQQPTYTALWLNNGTGEFIRVAEPSTYVAEIKSLIDYESQSGFLVSSASERLLAIGTNGFLLLARSDPNPVAPYSIMLSAFGRNCAAELSPCIARYPKRGPPAGLS